MSFAKSLVCVVCGHSHKPDKVIFMCDKCKGPLDITYDHKRIKGLLTDDFLTSEVSHWKYWPLYPVNDMKNAVSLGEGGTQLLELKRGLWIKNESTNPTCSFKDRGSTLEITKAKEHRVKEVVCASTGNMGASIAAYSARAGLKCTVYLPTRVRKSPRRTAY